jgi:hypothetical protein
MSRKAGRGCRVIIIKQSGTFGGKVSDDRELEVDCARTTVLLANAQVSPNIACAVDP